MRVLVVEDSLRLRQNLVKALKRSGYAADGAADGEEGLWMAQNAAYDVAVLDIMLPKLDGVTLLRRLREGGSDVPVIFLTARDTVEDRVHGLGAGADDYLVKPFALDELLARVQALCRRRYQRPDSRLRVADVELNGAARTVTRDGIPIDLPAREFKLLEYLMARQGQVVARGEIEEHIYDDLASPMSNVVDASVCAVRRKLAVRPNMPPLIHTRRGMGYVIGASPE
jgi:DNA-binding response OmpR family regulator